MGVVAGGRIMMVLSVPPQGLPSTGEALLDRILRGTNAFQPSVP
jgi:hypothetical protein